MSNEQVIADLQATKDRMTPDNWNPHGTYGTNKNGETTMCVLMHLREVVGTGAAYRYAAAGSALSRHVPKNESLGCIQPVGMYNDKSSTTFEDIQNLIDKTLADLGGMA